MIPAERIYLLPYYHSFLKTGPTGGGMIVTPLDALGEWIHKGIVYRTPSGDWTIVAIKTATRETLITLLERQEVANPKDLKRALLTVKAPANVVDAASKLGILTFRFKSEPTIPEIPCSLCGTRLSSLHYPWRCNECPREFGSDYRIVICHRCAIPFRTSPRLEREVHEALGDSAIWDSKTLCPDCRRTSLESPVLGFDGTIRNMILWGLIRGKLRLEGLGAKGAPQAYVDRVIRPAFMKMSTMPQGGPAVKALEMEPPKQLVGEQGSVELVEATDVASSESVVAISTTVATALGGTGEKGPPVNDLLESEISSLEQASRTGIVREPGESSKEYLKRISSTPPVIEAPDPSAVLKAMDADLVEACRTLPELDLDMLLRTGADIVSKLAVRLNTSQQRGEDLLTFISRLREMVQKGVGAEGEKRTARQFK